jgi:hypothetical protein
LDHALCNDRDLEQPSGRMLLSENNHSDNTSVKYRENILGLMDDFIEQITSIRRTLLGVSISAFLLSPFAIGLSIYLISHPSFFAILEIKNEFGFALSILLAAVYIISFTWLISGIRQYKSISPWNKRYNEYKKEKEKMDRKIALEYRFSFSPNLD